MRIVIDIPEDVYTRLFDNGIPTDIADGIVMERVIRLGTPLEKHDEEIINEVLDKVRTEVIWCAFDEKSTNTEKDRQRQIVIKIPQFVYKQILKSHVSKKTIASIFKNGTPLEQYEYRQEAKCLDCLLTEKVVIKDNITNGDVIKAMFPNASMYEQTPTMTYYGMMRFDTEWWNAKYKAVKEDKE